MSTSGDSLASLVNLGNLITGITGKSGSQTRTSTSKGNITQQGADRIIQQILAGRGGVKDISGAARGAGLYNSSTEAQLLNDLNARVAGEVAARQAGTTTTETTDLEQDGIGLGTLATPLIGAAVLRPILSSLLGDGTEAAASGASSLVNQGTPAASSLGTTPITAGAGFTTGGNLGNSLIPTISAPNNVIGSLVGGGSGALSGLGGAQGLAADLGMTAAEPGVATTVGQLGADAGLSGVPILGNVLAGLFGGNNGDAFGSPAGFASSALGGAAAMGPAGLIAAPVAAVFGNMLNDLGVKSIICTALQARGLLDKDEYSKSNAYLASMNRYTLRGYHVWAESVAKKIEAGNRFAIRATLGWARSRTKLLASNRNLVDYIRNPLGTITVFIGEPICYLIGRYLMKEDKYGYGS